jgi:hypothetical protein
MVATVIKVDIAAAMAGLQNVRQKQIPYATSLAINQCADASVNDLVIWVRSIFNFRGQQTAWIKSKWFKSRWSDKRNLTAYVLGMLDYLLLHEVGGIKTPHRGTSLAVPLGTLRYRRIPATLRPRYLLGTGDLQNVLKAASLGPRSRKKQLATFGQAFILDLNGKRFIAMRTGQDIGIPANAPRLKGIHLLYFLTPAVRIVPRLHMRDTVQKTVAREFNAAFARGMAEAIRTAH